MLHMQQFSVLPAVPKTRGMLLIEARIGRPLEGYLEDRYLRDGLTTLQIAAELGVNNGTVSRWMAQLGIEARYLGPRPKAIT
jgi:hypothetical protein